MTTTSILALRQLRDQAAREPLAALRGMRRKLEETGRPDLARVLSFVEEHVFEEGCEATAAAAVVGANPGAISPRIEAHTGYALDDLIARIRFETAVSLRAAHPEVSMEKLSEVLGLSVWRLRRLFKRWPAEAGREGRRGRAFDPGGAFACDLAARGKLSLDEAKKVLAHLRTVRPEAFAVPAPAAGGAPSRRDSGIAAAGLAAEPARSGAGSEVPMGVEDAAAERLWSELSCLSYSAQREVVGLYAFASRAFFDLLLRKSREAGRLDRRRGVEIAELAVLSVETSAALLGERFHEMKAEGFELGLGETEPPV